jgi:hypothetical protein
MRKFAPASRVSAPGSPANTGGRSTRNRNIRQPSWRR